MTPPESSPYRWVIAAAMLPLHIALGLNLFAPSPLLSLIIDEHGLSRGTASLMMTSVLVVFTIFLIPGSLIVAKLGTKRAILISGFLMTAGILSTVAPGFWAQLPLRVIFGVGGSILLPASAAAIVQWFSPQGRPLMNSLNLAGEGAGVAVAMFISIPIADAFGWRAVFLVYGGFTLLAATAWLLLGRTSPYGTGAIVSFPVSAVLGVLKERTTLLLSLAGVGPFAMFIAFSTWLPTYYHEVFGMSLEKGSSIVAIIPLMGVVVNLFAGVLLIKLGLRKPLLVVSGLVFPFAAFGTFYFDNLAVIVVSIVVLGVSFWIFLPTLFVIPMELPGISVEKVALVTAAALSIGNMSTIISPALVGITTDRLGTYVPSFSVLAVLPVTLLIATFFLPETGPRASPSPVAIRSAGGGS